MACAAGARSRRSSRKSARASAASWLGSPRYLAEHGSETPPLRNRLQSLASAGQTAVIVGQNEGVCGLITLADQPRPEARETAQALHDLGIRHVVMLTGDNPATARAIADQLGIDDVYAELLPEDKVAAVQELVRRHGRVAMVGDGTILAGVSQAARIRGGASGGQAV